MIRLLTLVCLAVVFAALSGCNPKDPLPKDGPQTDKTLSGVLIIFNAGSLAVPLKEVAAAFNKEYPDVKILTEAAGSRACARKISELHKPCDVMASADYSVIDTLLIPKFADWNIKFASNEMTLVYRDASRGAKEINKDNWYDVLMRDDLAFGRSDPNVDPCGYRTVLTMKLAEKFYKKPRRAEALLNKDTKYIRPKETDLLALLESGEIDYIFLYRSVGQQHGLKCLPLPDQINLKSPQYADYYARATVEISGKTPGGKVVKKGDPMIYGITIPKNAPNRPAALAFVAFLLDKNKGMAIMERNGQPSVVPSPTATFDKIPESLKQFAQAHGK